MGPLHRVDRVLVMVRIRALMTTRMPPPLTIPILGMLAPWTVLMLIPEELMMFTCRWAT